MSAPRSTTVAVVVGRFHVPQLHEGHVSLFETAFRECDEVLAVLGTPYTLSENDPLSFELRRLMLMGRFPHRPLRIIESPSLPSSSEARSQLLDEIIDLECAGKRPVIYGSSDSIVHKYTGRHPTRETDTITSVRGTEIRKAIMPKDSVVFREGAIYAVRTLKPRPYPAVDVAPVWGNRKEVMLISKPEDEGKFRFAGVFYNPNEPAFDESFENAARRCIDKELGGINAGIPVPVGSRKIIDPRFKRTRDGVISTLMRVSYAGQTPALSPGIVRIEWMPMWFDEVPGYIIDMHRPLAEILRRQWFGC